MLKSCTFVPTKSGRRSPLRLVKGRPKITKLELPASFILPFQPPQCNLVTRGRKSESYHAGGRATRLRINLDDSLLLGLGRLCSRQINTASSDAGRASEFKSRGQRTCFCKQRSRSCPGRLGMNIRVERRLMDTDAVWSLVRNLAGMARCLGAAAWWLEGRRFTTAGDWLRVVASEGGGGVDIPR